MAERAAPTPEDRQVTKHFLLQIAERYPGGWDKLLLDTDLKPLTAQGWRVGTPAAKRGGPVIPDGLSLLKLLRTAGALTEETVTLLEESERRAAEAVATAARFEASVRDSPPPVSKKRPPTEDPQ